MILLKIGAALLVVLSLSALPIIFEHYQKTPEVIHPHDFDEPSPLDNRSRAIILAWLGALIAGVVLCSGAFR
jgi:hypothetical protein